MHPLGQRALELAPAVDAVCGAGTRARPGTTYTEPVREKGQGRDGPGTPYGGTTGQVASGRSPSRRDGDRVEVFVREEGSEALRHAGSITASDAETAYEEATKLFAWYADDVWLCRAGDVHRYAVHDLDEAAEPAPIERGDEPRATE